MLYTATRMIFFKLWIFSLWFIFFC